MSGLYRCNHCKKTVKRDSRKRWIKSMCDVTGKTTRLWRVGEWEVISETS